MRVIGRLLLVLALLLPQLALAQTPPTRAVAVLDAAASALTAEGREGRPRPLDLRLALSRAVPYRAYVVGGPPRLVLDFRQVDFGAQRPEALAGADLVPGIRWGSYRRGWTRMVVELPGPARLASAEMRAEPQGATLALRLEPVDMADFAPHGGDAPESALWDLPPPAAVPPVPPRRDGRLRVMLDPGHGGIDPGAIAGNMTEADLMLTFAEELAALLRRAGVEVMLTREGDEFVGLEARATAARAAGADVLISLHADALPDGGAAGTAFYIWNENADDRAAAQLALRHDRDDLLAGMDLTGTDDEVTGVLMDLARRDTQPRSEALAGFMVAEARRAGLPLHRRPLQQAAFSVLKSPDIPSILIETGFLTDPADRARLAEPSGRAGLVAALARAILNWAHDDRIRAPLLRQ